MFATVVSRVVTASVAVVCLTLVDGGCTRSDGGCRHVDPQDREAPSPLLSLIDRSSYETLRYQNFAVYLPHVKDPIVATADNPKVLRFMLARVGAIGAYSTVFTPVDAGTTTVRLVSPTGERYSLAVTVKC